MKLTRGEYCQFNLKSRLQLLDNKGIFLIERRFANEHKIILFSIYDFYVEVLYDIKQDKVLKVQPILTNNWLDIYLENINLSNLFD